MLSTSEPPPQPETEDQEITPEELQQQGFDIEHDQLTPEETHGEGHPTPKHPTGRIGL